MRERLERIMNIRSEEWNDVLYFGLFNTFIWAGLTIGESVAEALFLKKVGIDFLPYMFILCPLVAFPINILYEDAAKKIELRRLSSILILGVVATVFLCMALIASGFSIFQIPIGFGLLYIVQSAAAALLAIHFNILISGRFTTLTAKRLFPLILGGSVVGSIGGGLLVNLYAESLGTVNLLWIWSLLLGICEIWVLLGGDMLSSTLAKISSEPEEIIPQYAAKSKIARWIYEAKAVFSTPLLALLAISTLLMTVCRYFIEYQYSEIFSAHFSTEASLAGFVGIYTLVANLLTLLIQGFITGRLIQHLGVSGANLIYPLTNLAAFAATAVSYTLPSGVFARFNQEGLRRALFQPVINLFYNVIPPKRRIRSIAFNEGIVIPTGTVLAAAVIISLRRYKLLFLTFPILTAVVWCILAWKQRQVYTQSLIELLRRSQLDELANNEQELGTLDAHTQALVVDSLRDNNDEVAELAADILIRYGNSSARNALLHEIAVTHTSLQIILLEKLAAFPGADTRFTLLQALESSDEKVQLAALKALIKYPPDDKIRNATARFLDSPNPHLSAAAAACAVRGGDLGETLKALVVFRDLLAASNSNMTALGIQALGATREGRFWVNLKPFLTSPQPSLRLAAAQAMDLMIAAEGGTEYLEMLRLLINDDLREIRALAIRACGRVFTRESTLLLLEALNDKSPHNRRLAFEMLASRSSEILPDLLMILDDINASIYAQESAVRLLSLSQDYNIRERLYRFGLEQIRLIYEAKIDEATLESELPNCHAEYLIMVLRERAQALLRLVLAVAAPQQNREVSLVFKGLYSQNQETMSNAIEALQTMGEHKLLSYVLPILEGISLERTADYGSRNFGLERRNARLVLGKYLVSIDKVLKEAAIYTVGIAGITELAAAVQKIQRSDANLDDIVDVCNWTLEHLNAFENRDIYDSRRKSDNYKGYI